MARSIRRATSVLALSAAMAAAGSIEMTSGVGAVSLRGKAQATQIAAQISRKIDVVSVNPEIAPVPGILKGIVELHSGEFGGTSYFRNPVLLWASHSISQIDKNSKLINGSWIGVPGFNSYGRLVLEPLQIELGKVPEAGTQYFNTTTEYLNNTGEAILEGYGVEVPPPPTPTSVSKGLVGVNLQNSSSPNIPITTL